MKHEGEVMVVIQCPNCDLHFGTVLKEAELNKVVPDIPGEAPISMYFTIKDPREPKKAVND